MKKLLLAGVAFAGLVAGAGAVSAADLPSRAAAPMAPMMSAVPLFTWTGFYVGVQAGYGWGNDDDRFGDAFVLEDGALVPFEGGFGGDSDGFIAGAHIGYNVQFGSFVVGVEGDLEGVFGDDDDDDFDGIILRNAAGDPVAFSVGANSLDWQGSIRARAGFAFDRALIYATGGFAFGGVSGGFSSGLIDNDDDTLTGYTLGAGVEYAFTNNLTARVEYRYTNFDRDDSVFDGVAFGNDDFDFHTVRVGLSYKF
jgi:outer membrane immunogenic protein